MNPLVSGIIIGAFLTLFTLFCICKYLDSQLPDFSIELWLDLFRENEQLRKTMSDVIRLLQKGGIKL